MAVGRMLARLQAECIFDLDDTSTSIKATGGEAASDTIDDELWERLQREELELDPRVSAYRSFRTDAEGTDDEILLRLQAMLGQVPYRETLGPITASEAKGGDGSTADTFSSPTRSASTEASPPGPQPTSSTRIPGRR